MPKIQLDKTNQRYHTTIPKETIDLLGLKPGDLAYFNVSPDGKISIEIRKNPKE